MLSQLYLILVVVLSLVTAEQNLRISNSHPNFSDTIISAKCEGDSLTAGDTTYHHVIDISYDGLSRINHHEMNTLRIQPTTIADHSDTVGCETTDIEIVYNAAPQLWTLTATSKCLALKLVLVGVPFLGGTWGIEGEPTGATYRLHRVAEGVEPTTCSGHVFWVLPTSISPVPDLFTMLDDDKAGRAREVSAKFKLPEYIYKSIASPPMTLSSLKFCLSVSNTIVHSNSYSLKAEDFQIGANATTEAVVVGAEGQLIACLLLRPSDVSYYQSKLAIRESLGTLSLSFSNIYFHPQVSLGITVSIHHCADIDTCIHAASGTTSVMTGSPFVSSMTLISGYPFGQSLLLPTGVATTQILTLNDLTLGFTLSGAVGTRIEVDLCCSMGVKPRFTAELLSYGDGNKLNPIPPKGTEQFPGFVIDSLSSIGSKIIINLEDRVLTPTQASATSYISLKIRGVYATIPVVEAHFNITHYSSPGDASSTRVAGTILAGISQPPTFQVTAIRNDGLPSYYYRSLNGPSISLSITVDEYAYLGPGIMVNIQTFTSFDPVSAEPLLGTNVLSCIDFVVKNEPMPLMHNTQSIIIMDYAGSNDGDQRTLHCLLRYLIRGNLTHKTSESGSLTFGISVTTVSANGTWQSPQTGAGLSPLTLSGPRDSGDTMQVDMQPAGVLLHSTPSSLDVHLLFSFQLVAGDKIRFDLGNNNQGGTSRLPGYDQVKPYPGSTIPFDTCTLVSYRIYECTLTRDYPMSVYEGLGLSSISAELHFSIYVQYSESGLVSDATVSYVSRSNHVRLFNLSPRFYYTVHSRTVPTLIVSFGESHSVATEIVSARRLPIYHDKFSSTVQPPLPPDTPVHDHLALTYQACQSKDPWFDYKLYTDQDHHFLHGWHHNCPNKTDCSMYVRDPPVDYRGASMRTSNAGARTGYELPSTLSLIAIAKSPCTSSVSANDVVGGRLFFTYDRACESQIESSKLLPLANFDDCRRGVIRHTPPYCTVGYRELPHDCVQKEKKALDAIISITPLPANLDRRVLDVSRLDPLRCPPNINTQDPNVQADMAGAIFASAPYYDASQCQVSTPVCTAATLPVNQNDPSGRLSIDSDRSTAFLRLQSNNYGERSGGIGLRLWNAPSPNPVHRPLAYEYPAYKLTMRFQRSIPVALFSDTNEGNLYESIPFPRPTDAQLTSPSKLKIYRSITRTMTIWVNGHDEFCRSLKTCGSCSLHTSTVNCVWDTYRGTCRRYDGPNAPTSDCGCTELGSSYSSCTSNPNCLYCLREVGEAICIPGVPSTRSLDITKCHPTAALPLRHKQITVSYPNVTRVEGTPTEHPIAQVFLRALLGTTNIQFSPTSLTYIRPGVLADTELIVPAFTFGNDDWLDHCSTCLKTVTGSWSRNPYHPTPAFVPPKTHSQPLATILPLSAISMTSQPASLGGHQYVYRGAPFSFAILRHYIVTIHVSLSPEEQYPFGILLNRHDSSLRSLCGRNKWMHYAVQWGNLRSTPGCSTSGSISGDDSGYLRLVRQTYDQSISSAIQTVVLWEEPVQYAVGTNTTMVIGVSEVNDGVMIAVSASSHVNAPEGIHPFRFHYTDTDTNRIIRGGTVGLQSLGALSASFVPEHVSVRVPHLDATSSNPTRHDLEMPMLMKLVTNKYTSDPSVRGIVSLVLFTQAANTRQNFQPSVEAFPTSLPNQCILFVLIQSVTGVTTMTIPPGSKIGDTLSVGLAPGRVVAVAANHKCAHFGVNLIPRSYTNNQKRITMATGDNGWRCKHDASITDAPDLLKYTSPNNASIHQIAPLGSSSCSDCFTPPQYIDLDPSTTQLSAVRTRYIQVPPGSTSPYVCVFVVPSAGEGFDMRVSASSSATAPDTHVIRGGGYQPHFTAWELVRFPPSQYGMPQVTQYPMIHFEGDKLPLLDEDLYVLVSDVYLLNIPAYSIHYEVLLASSYSHENYASIDVANPLPLNRAGVAVIKLSCPDNQEYFDRILTLTLAEPRDGDVICLLNREKPAGLYSSATAPMSLCSQISATTYQVTYTHAADIVLYLSLFLSPARQDSSEIMSVADLASFVTYRCILDAPRIVRTVPPMPAQFTGNNPTNTISMQFANVLNMNSVSVGLMISPAEMIPCSCSFADYTLSCSVPNAVGPGYTLTANVTNLGPPHQITVGLVAFFVTEPPIMTHSGHPLRFALAPLADNVNEDRNVITFSGSVTSGFDLPTLTLRATATVDATGDQVELILYARTGSVFKFLAPSNAWGGVSITLEVLTGFGAKYYFPFTVYFPLKEYIPTVLSQSPIPPGTASLVDFLLTDINHAFPYPPIDFESQYYILANARPCTGTNRVEPQPQLVYYCFRKTGTFPPTYAELDVSLKPLPYDLGAFTDELGCRELALRRGFTHFGEVMLPSGSRCYGGIDTFIRFPLPPLVDSRASCAFHYTHDIIITSIQMTIMISAVCPLKQRFCYSGLRTASVNAPTFNAVIHQTQYKINHGLTFAPATVESASVGSPEVGLPYVGTIHGTNFGVSPYPYSLILDTVSGGQVYTQSLGFHSDSNDTHLYFVHTPVIAGVQLSFRLLGTNGYSMSIPILDVMTLNGTMVYERDLSLFDTSISFVAYKTLRSITAPTRFGVRLTDGTYEEVNNQQGGCSLDPTLADTWRCSFTFPSPRGQIVPQYATDGGIYLALKHTYPGDIIMWALIGNPLPFVHLNLTDAVQLSSTSSVQLRGTGHLPTWEDHQEVLQARLTGQYALLPEWRTIDIPLTCTTVMSNSQLRIFHLDCQIPVSLRIGGPGFVATIISGPRGGRSPTYNTSINFTVSDPFIESIIPVDVSINPTGTTFEAHGTSFSPLITLFMGERPIPPENLDVVTSVLLRFTLPSKNPDQAEGGGFALRIKQLGDMFHFPLVIMSERVSTTFKYGDPQITSLSPRLLSTSTQNALSLQGRSLGVTPGIADVKRYLLLYHNYRGLRTARPRKCVLADILADPLGCADYVIQVHDANLNWQPNAEQASVLVTLPPGRGGSTFTVVYLVQTLPNTEQVGMNQTSDPYDPSLSMIDALTFPQHTFTALTGCVNVGVRTVGCPRSGDVSITIHGTGFGPSLPIEGDPMLPPIVVSLTLTLPQVNPNTPPLVTTFNLDLLSVTDTAIVVRLPSISFPAFNVPLQVTIDQYFVTRRYLSFDGHLILDGTLRLCDGPDPETFTRDSLNVTHVRLPHVHGGLEICGRGSLELVDISEVVGLVGPEEWMLEPSTAHTGWLPCNVTFMNTTDFRCTLSEGVGTNMKLRLRVKGIDSVQPSEDLISTPLPTFVPATIRERPEDPIGSSSFTSKSSRGSIVSFNLLHLPLSSNPIVTFTNANSTFVKNGTYPLTTTSCSVYALLESGIEVNRTLQQTTVVCRMPRASGPDFEPHISLPHGASSLPYPLGINVFNYPLVAPIVRSISGCQLAPPDPISGNITSTIECPTTGGVRLTIYGENFCDPLDPSCRVLVRLGGAADRICGNAETIDEQTLTCDLPEGTGTHYPVVAIQDDLSYETRFVSVSYAGPIVERVYGCTSDDTATGAVGCSDTASQQRITIEGSNFGPSSAQVLVGGQPCKDVIHDSLSPHNKMTCFPPSAVALSDLTVTLIVPDAPDPKPGEDAVTVSFRVCPVGSIPASPSSTNDMSPVCLPCSPGRYALAGASICTPCSPGTYSLGNTTSCLLCEPGKYAQHSNASICTPCPANTYSLRSGAIECSSCNAGSMGDVPLPIACRACPRNYGFHVHTIGNRPVSSCTLCPDGTQADNADGTCIPCEPGTYSNATTIAAAASNPALHACLPCQPGKFSSTASARMCTDCLAGAFASNSGSVACIPCEFGSWNGQPGSTSCDQCSFGSISFASRFLTSAMAISDLPPALTLDRCSLCPSGYFAPRNGSSQCVPCPAGKHSGLQNGAHQCLPCHNGTYSGTEGAIICTPCNDGTFSPLLDTSVYQTSSGTTACHACPVGSIASIQASVCQQCSPGYYSSDGLACVPCPINTFSTTGEPCQACPPGTTTLQKTSAASCTPCDVGKYWESSTNSIAVCRDAPVGSYVPEPGATHATLCEAGKHAPSTGLSTCLACGAGNYSSAGSPICLQCTSGRFSASQSGECSTCPIGRYSTTGSSECIICEAGKVRGLVSDGPNGVLLPGCLDCPVGTYSSNSGSESCAECSPGTYANTTRSSTCRVCEPGKTSATFSTVECTSCTSGKYMPTEGSAVSSCMDCEAGRYALSAGMSRCDACSPGSARLPGELGGVRCNTCPAGRYSQTGQALCSICAKGSFSSAGSAGCTLCSQGKFAADPGQSVCVSCGIGTFAPFSGSFTCSSCPVGAFQNETNASACHTCPRGRFNPDTASSKCDPCPRGRFAGEPGQSACLPCSAGRHSPNLGMDECLDCSPGRAQPQADKSFCYDCAPGSTAVQRSVVCTTCAAGRFAPIAGFGPCEACSTGRYSLANATECLPCARGKVQPNTGESTCLHCSAGQVAHDEGLAQCSPCHSPLTGIITGERCVCMAGYYVKSASSNGSTTLPINTQPSDCVLCPPGADCAIENLHFDFLGTERAFWRSSADSETFYRCPVPHACGGGPGAGKCADRWEGILCSSCANGYYAVAGECESCASSNAHVQIALVSIAVLAIVTALFWLVAAADEDIVAQAEDQEFKALSSNPSTERGGAIIDEDGNLSSTVFVPSPLSRQSMASSTLRSPSTLRSSAVLPSSPSSLLNAGTARNSIAVIAGPLITAARIEASRHRTLTQTTSTQVNDDRKGSTPTNGSNSPKPGSSTKNNVDGKNDVEGKNDTSQELDTAQWEFIYQVSTEDVKAQMMTLEERRTLAVRNTEAGIPAVVTKVKIFVSWAQLTAILIALPEVPWYRSVYKLGGFLQLFLFYVESWSGWFCTFDRTYYNHFWFTATFVVILVLLAFLNFTFPLLIARRALPSYLNSCVSFISRLCCCCCCRAPSCCRPASSNHHPSPSHLPPSVHDFGVELQSMPSYEPTTNTSSLSGHLHSDTLTSPTEPQTDLGIAKPSYSATEDEIAQTHRSVILAQTLKSLQLVYYFLYPRLCLTLFGLFNCRTVNSETYIADFMASYCYDDDYYRYLPFVIALGIILLIGIPLLLFFRLRHHAHEDSQSYPMTRLRLGFFYQGYRPGCWWFDLVDLSIKFLLAALTPLVAVDGQLQYFMGIVTCYIISIYLFSPHRRKGDDALHLYSLLSLIAVAMTGYILREGIMSDSPTLYINEVCVMLVLSLVMLYFVIQLGHIARKLWRQR